MWIGQRAEPDWVPHGHGSSTHGEDVAQDAADAGCRALIRLNERWVVVTLDPQGRQPVVTEVDDACILAGADDNPRGLGGEAAEPGTR